MTQGGPCGIMARHILVALSCQGGSALQEAVTYGARASRGAPVFPARPWVVDRLLYVHA